MNFSYTVTLLVGLGGGLSIILRSIVVLLVKISLHFKRRSSSDNADQSILTLYPQ